MVAAFQFYVKFLNLRKAVANSNSKKKQNKKEKEQATLPLAYFQNIYNRKVEYAGIFIMLFSSVG